MDTVRTNSISSIQCKFYIFTIQQFVQIFLHFRSASDVSTARPLQEEPSTFTHEQETL